MRIGKARDVRPRPDADQDVSEGELRDRRWSRADLDAGEEFGGERGATGDVAVDGTHTDELGVGRSRCTPKGHCVVRIVANIGVDPEAHQ